jgi:hypothetical protein
MFTLRYLVVLAATFAGALAAPFTVTARAGAPFIVPIHPSANTNKCVGLVGGVFADGTFVDV